jgi:hypothetical protein
MNEGGRFILQSAAKARFSSLRSRATAEQKAQLHCIATLEETSQRKHTSQTSRAHQVCFGEHDDESFCSHSWYMLHLDINPITKFLL